MSDKRTLSKLKTLKDIYDTSKMSYISDEAQEVVDNLRKVARKWIKELEKYNGSCATYPLPSHVQEYAVFVPGEQIWDTSSAINLFKHFFNLE